MGDLDDYRFYNPGTSLNPFDPNIETDEADFNFIIHPDAGFTFLIDEVSALMSAGDRRDELIRRKRGPGLCIECEATPDEEYYDNSHFRTKEPYTTSLLGSKMGLYGPWVRDMPHGGRPEIHPCEILWWRLGSFDAIGRKPFVRWTVVILQDDSNRFDRRNNYFGGVVNRPWSEPPRRAHITMGLQAKRGKDSVYYLNMRDGHRIFDWPGEEARSVTTRFGADTSLTVTKRMSRRSEVKVRLSSMDVDPTDATKVRCFVELDIQVGEVEGDRGKEGFAELSVEHWVPMDESPPEVATPTNPPQGPRPPVVPDRPRPRPKPGEGQRPQEP